VYLQEVIFVSKDAIFNPPKAIRYELTRTVRSLNSVQVADSGPRRRSSYSYYSMMHIINTQREPVSATASCCCMTGRHRKLEFDLELGVQKSCVSRAGLLIWPIHVRAADE
jgi:hypothetical protein